MLEHRIRDSANITLTLAFGKTVIPEVPFTRTVRHI